MILAFTGPKTVGKTTLGTALAEALDIPVVVLSFAEPLRRMLSALGVDHTALYVEKEAPIRGIGKSGRELLQSLGTEWGRSMVHPEIWLWAMDKQIGRARANAMANGETDLLILIDDCRFANEAEYIGSRGGYVLGLRRQGVDYTGEHITERPISAQLIHHWIDCDNIPTAVQSCRQYLRI